MTWHEWITKHEEAKKEIARDFILTVDFEGKQGQLSKAFYRNSTIPEIPAGKVLIVEYRIEDGDE